MLVKISNEHNVNRNLEYKIFLESLPKVNIRSDIYNIFSAGKNFEMKYNIRRHKECEQKENKFINTLVELEKVKHDKIIQELIKLKRENIILKYALNYVLNKADIKIKLEDWYMITEKDIQKINQLIQAGKEVIISYQKSKQKIILKEIQKIK